uniref:Endothelin-like toxin domain-containing protein n=1 Tax=Oncorhynchus mykiss TaxID=8022 RepID=A0A8C7NDZ7_ONCMY
MLLYNNFGQVTSNCKGLQRPKSSDLAPPHRVRTKRCACNNQLDSECHYFCHLDIIWVNTPSKTTVYGLGSPLSRRRRSAGRCVCADSDDHTCTSFCQDSSLLWDSIISLRECCCVCHTGVPSRGGMLPSARRCSVIPGCVIPTACFDWLKGQGSEVSRTLKN